MSAVLHLSGLGRRFGGLAALHDIDLDVAAGACHAVIGPNGAGKTTLVNLIAGTLRASSGTILFDGSDITRLPAPARTRRGIGRTFQHPALFGRLSVAANLTLALTHHDDRPPVTTRPHRRTVTAAALQVADEAGLADHATTPAARLPYGLQRRLDLAMALATRPRLLLLDEPSAGLDPDELAQLADRIRGLAFHTTVLLVDHNLDLVWSLADTVTVLHHGRLLATSPPDRIRADPQVRAAYLSSADQPTGRPPAPRPAGAALLRVRNLRAGYHGAPVIDGLDLDIHDGEALAVLGRNGAGKTTLLGAIAGLLPPQPPSRIDLAGTPLTGSRRPHHTARAGVAFVPQGRRLFGPLTVAEHLTCAQAAHRHTTRPPVGGQTWTTDRILAAMPALAGRLRHRAHRLSGGEQQMLALARALLTNPRLLILDEPGEGLAPTVIEQLTTTLTGLVADGLALLVAEQNLRLATALAHRVVVLDRGHIALTCATSHLPDTRHHTQLQRLLGVAAPAAHAEARPVPAAEGKPY